MIQPIEASRFAGRSLSHFEPNLSLPRHRWYGFKEGFSEELVKTAIEKLSGESRVLRILDPFAGSGTSLVAAGRLGHQATGLEVNPFLAFAARAKCTTAKWREKSFNRTLESITNSSGGETRSPVEGFSTFTEKPSLEKWLFNTSVVRRFTVLQQAISRHPTYRRPLMLALFASLMDCCNAKRDGKCLRYRTNWQNLSFDGDQLREIFGTRARTVCDDILQHPFRGENLRILNGDSRKRLRELGGERFNLLITSPPYLNSFDYSDVYRPELFLGGFVRTNEELRRIRLRTLRSHVQVNWKAAPSVNSSLLKPILEGLREVKLWNPRLPEMVNSYFVDIAQTLKDASQLMRKDGEAWIVVATSAYGGVEVPVDLILADIATKNGWDLDGVYVLRQLRSAGQHWSRQEDRKRLPLRESLIILKRKLGLVKD